MVKLGDPLAKVRLERGIGRTKMKGQTIYSLLEIINHTPHIVLGPLNPTYPIAPNPYI